MWSVCTVANILHQDVEYANVAGWFFFFYIPFPVTVWKNQLLIRFCAAVGSAFSFLQATVGGWNGQAGKGSSIHVRSTQRVPKLDHVSAPTRSLQMEHKSPLTSWKMTGNQICTTYGINAMEMSLLTENRSLSVKGKDFTSFSFIFWAQTEPSIWNLETFSSIIHCDSTISSKEFTWKMCPEVETLLHWMAAALKGGH